MSKEIDGQIPIAIYLKRKIAGEDESVVSIAQQIGVHAQTLYNVTKRGRSISSNLAIKLSKRFPESVEFWLEKFVDLSETNYVPHKNIPPLNQLASKAAYRPSTGPDYILLDRDLKSLLSVPDGSLIIDPYNEDNVQSASYDLTIGLIVEEGFKQLGEYRWADVMNGKATTTNLHVKHSDQVTLEKGSSIHIIAREKIKFGSKFMALIGSTSSNAKNGLLISHGIKVDPGYDGPITISATNICNEPINLKRGDPFLTLIIYRISSAPDKVYLEDSSNRIISIGSNIENRIHGLFDYKDKLGNGKCKAEWTQPDITFFADSKEDAMDEALRRIVAILTDPDDPSNKNPEFVEGLKGVLDTVTLRKKDVKALIRFFDIDDSVKITQALDTRFKTKSSIQSFLDTSKRLGLNPFEAAITLLNYDHN